MRFYNQPHQYYCGGDLHARTLFLHILDDQGTTRFAKNLPANPAAFLEAVAPFRDGLVVGVECMFAWYWLADLCEAERIPFVLGHALAMKCIHGGKTKTDKIDAMKLATMLRGGLFPQAYGSPKAKRATRDLLRMDKGDILLFMGRRRFCTFLLAARSKSRMSPLSRRKSLISCEFCRELLHARLRPSVANDRNV